MDLPSTQIIHTHNTHRHNTTPPSQTLAQAAHHSPTTPPIPPQPKHRHISHFPHVPPELINPKLSPVTHSPPTPPTRPRAKHIHMPYTPPTPLTTLICSTSPALAKTPEPRVSHIYALTASTPLRTPHQHCRHPCTLTVSPQTHMQHKQQYMHHIHRNNRTHDIGYLTDRPRTTTGLHTEVD